MKFAGGRGIGTYRSRYAPLLVRQLSDRRPILIATKATLFMEQDTNQNEEALILRWRPRMAFLPGLDG